MENKATQAYVGWVTYTVDGEERTLTVALMGGPIDYYWNAGLAKAFYATRIEREGGVITEYGSKGGDESTLTALRAA